MKPSLRNNSPVFRLVIVLIFAIAMTAGSAFAQTSIPAPSYSDAPDADRLAIQAAGVLSGQGKWRSAWNLLGDYDPENAKPYVLAEKIRIALDGHAQTTMHLVFGFVDLEAGEDLDLVRYELTEELEPFDFNPGELAKALEDKGEAMPPELSLLLGDYYYNVWQNYQGGWIQDDETILGLGLEQYERALAYEFYSAASLGRHSELLLLLDRADAAETVVRKALELEPDNNSFRLRLAEILYTAQRYEEVYPLADKVIETAADDAELNDAYIVAIKAALDVLDAGLLDTYISGLEKSFPTDYMPGLIRHLVAVQLQDAEGADAAADAVTLAFPGNPDVIRSVLSTWLSGNDTDSGFRYLDRMIPLATLDEAKAALYFYWALLGSETAETTDALAAAIVDVVTAEEYFKKTYPEGHEVFGMIEELKTEWAGSISAYEEAVAEQSAAIAAAAEAAASAPEVPAEVPAETPAEETDDADTTSAASEAWD